MKDRRMISKKALATDTFHSFSDKTKVLYFMLLLNADDDGFVSDTKGIMKHFNARPMHLRMLIESNYIIHFNSGIALIVHWKAHNSIRPDRYRETDWVNERSMVYVDDKGCYHLIDGYRMVENLSVQVVSKVKKSKVVEDVVRPLRATATHTALLSEENGEENESFDHSLEKQLKAFYHTNGEGVIYMTDQQFDDLLEKLGKEAFDLYLERLSEYIIQKNAHIKSHYDTILRWYLQDSAVRK